MLRNMRTIPKCHSESCEISFQEILTASKEKENDFPKPQLRHVKSVEGGNISDRLEQMKSNSEKWKNRVGEIMIFLGYI